MKTQTKVKTTLLQKVLYLPKIKEETRAANMGCQKVQQLEWNKLWR